MRAPGGERFGRAFLRGISLVGVASVALHLVAHPSGFAAPRAPALQPSASPPRGSRTRRSAAASDDAKQSAKAALLDLLSDETIEAEVMTTEGKPIRGQVNEKIVLLERFNDCEEPAYSELLDGTWTVKYSGAYAPGLLPSPTREFALFGLYGGGFSLGNVLTSFAEGLWGQPLGLKLGAKTVRIDFGRDVEATVELEVGGRNEVLSYSAELMPLSARRLSEEIMNVELPALGKRDAPLELRRSILVTYLDEEVMIVRDESGVPDVLTRSLLPTTPVSEPEMEPTDVQSDDLATDAVLGEDPLSSDAS